MLAAIAITPAAALASDWPTQQPVQVIVPYPPGGSSDLIARVLAPLVSMEIGQTVVVENRPGANGNLGAGQVARAKPDGYTVLLADLGALAISPSLYKDLRFDPSKDLTGVSMLVYTPHLLVVHPSVPATTLPELIAHSKQNDLNFAVTASGSAPHLAGIALQQIAGGEWVYVPYKGGAQSVQDTVAGQTQVLMNGMLATYPQVKSGNLRLIGLSKKTPMQGFEDLPTLASQGADGFETGSWQGLMVPAGTPATVVQRIHDAFAKATQDPATAKRLTEQGAEIASMTPAQTNDFFNQERARWQKVVQDSGLTLD
ncbi:tripartite tricarboxylate transporter substrate binding protein [Corticibacter populi]|uniref:Tripartite tricarboxylate transporter substrate binding protein n=1 Tax=Corticibacter populi TaxID=1550736 RepID=A0A3M6R0R3_9BURK|nr:tripartite tricarboxylate transporter substrate binding protein [Corticibacter populi]RMX08838.1 tripartite tricarboxylate transporter substrate binding protein [Corticibacter populi]